MLTPNQQKHAKKTEPQTRHPLAAPWGSNPYLSLSTTLKVGGAWGMQRFRCVETISSSVLGLGQVAHYTRTGQVAHTFSAQALKVPGAWLIGRQGLWAPAGSASPGRER